MPIRWGAPAAGARGLLCSCAMRSSYLAILAIACLPAACDDAGGASGARGPCASSGDILSCDAPVETAEDACWRLVECAVFPVDAADEGGIDWGRCVNRLESFDDVTRSAAIDCVALSSCDALAARGGPIGPWEWPDCLEVD